ncbi:sensor histidine kinase [Streptomyces sp. NPDC090054]|uniref:sensor histidine kinase n=1 Tax=Streptomyces sp. NPDC090054 TaxID=3365933 RepID=UPI003800F470
MQRWRAVRRRTERLVTRVSGSPGARPFGERGTLVLLAVLLAPAVLEAGRLTSAPGPWLAALLMITAAVAVERTVPLLSLLLAASLCGLYPWLGSSAWTAVAALVLSFLAGSRLTAPARAHAVFAAVALTGLAVTAGFAEMKDWLSLLMVGFATSVLPWWVGYWWSRRAALMHAGWERAERLEWKQRYIAEQARLKERSRIAEDIHDSLGHELSVMALLSGALELARGVPEEHRATVTQLRERCTRAAEQLHEVIGLLRDEGSPSPLSPSDESIAELVRRFERSGMAVRFVEEGEDAPPLALLADRAAYRVVQEALTNATKHAPGAAITVRVTHRPRESVVWVFNKLPDQPAEAPAVGSGSGLIGLDERVRLAGGSLRTGPGSGGFEVLARLPRTPLTATETAADPDGGDGTDGGRAPGEALGAGGFEDTEPYPHPEAAPPPGRSHSGAALGRARTRLRRDVRRAGRIPVLLGAGLVALLAGLYVFTSALTSLDPGDYARIRPGQPRAELAAVLPERRISKPPPVVSEPPVPAGAACEYYRTGGNVLQLTNRMYRLCFKDDLLVAKDSL